MIASARIIHHTACLLACVRHFSPRALQGGSSEDLSSSPELHGRPLSPVIPGTGSVLLRYTYEGASIAQGRLCTLEAEQDGLITGRSLLLALQADGVDFGRFYACAYETEESSGGWLPVLRDVTDPADNSYDDPFRIPTVPPAEPTDDAESGAPVGRRRWRFYPKDAPKRRRVDCKLCRRDAALSSGEEAARTEDKRTLGRSSFSALGVVGVKNEENVGTLWRSAYQLGVSMLFTVAARYEAQRTDTLNVPKRLPYMHFEHWADFARSAPRGAVLVGVEMGGTPLEEFEHPDRAVYLLGSEDNGLPPNVVQACHRVVTISSARAASFNVAMAGSIVLHDRLAKRKLAQEPPDG